MKKSLLQKNYYTNLKIFSKLGLLLFLLIPFSAFAQWNNSPIQVDNAASVGQHTSLAIVNGNPAISYYDQTNGALNFVRATDASGTAWSSPIQVDNSGIVGLYTSLAIVNGNPAISYRDVSNSALNFVRATDASGTAWDCPNQVDNAASVGSYTSLAIVNGNPAISYYDGTNSALNFVRASINFSGGGFSFTVDDLGDASDNSIGDGICATAGGVCTLRAAVEEANAQSFTTLASNPIPITINQSGTINISSSLPNIEANLSITGHSSGTVIMDNGTLSSDVLIIGGNCDVEVTISDITFDGGDAGGVTVDGSTAAFNNCVFQNVSGSTEQALNIIQGSTVNLNQCSFLNNSSTNHGGAMEIRNSATTVTATNCTFSGNNNTGASYDKRGGAIMMNNASASLSLINCTVVNNETGTGGGGGVNVNRGTLHLINTIIANNTENDGSTVTDNDLEFANHADVGFGTNTTNLVENCEDNGATECDAGFTSMNDPNLAAAATCGTPVQTYFAPQSPSDALDNGTAPGGSIPATDICGQSRAVAHDIGAYDAGGVLPVELLYFKVQKKDIGVGLYWQTAAETNNEGFEIQWAENSPQSAVSSPSLWDWQSVGFVAGAGTTFEKQNYSFLHENPREGINYYRLKQIDYDGVFEYSEVVSVQLAVGSRQFCLTPN